MKTAGIAFLITAALLSVYVIGAVILGGLKKTAEELDKQPKPEEQKRLREERAQRAKEWKL